MALALFAAAAHQPAVLHYRRTNSDGTEPETVVVFALDPRSVHVFKAKSRCTSAAYVVATTHPETGQVVSLVGGRLTRQLDQQPAAYLDREGDGHLRVRVGARDAIPIFDITVGERWMLYDFDFADLAAHPPKEILQRQSLSFDLPLFLTGDNAPRIVNRGKLELRFARAERRNGRAVLRFAATGPALGKASGALWFDARDGVLAEARLPLANHSEYRDFRLVLQRRERGIDAWRARLAEHWRGCEPPRG